MIIILLYNINIFISKLILVIRLIIRKLVLKLNLINILKSNSLKFLVNFILNIYYILIKYYKFTIQVIKIKT